MHPFQSPAPPEPNLKTTRVSLCVTHAWIHPLLTFPFIYTRAMARPAIWAYSWQPTCLLSTTLTYYTTDGGIGILSFFPEGVEAKESNLLWFICIANTRPSASSSLRTSPRTKTKPAERKKLRSSAVPRIRIRLVRWVFSLHLWDGMRIQIHVYSQKTHAHSYTERKERERQLHGCPFFTEWRPTRSTSAYYESFKLNRRWLNHYCDASTSFPCNIMVQLYNYIINSR